MQMPQKLRRAAGLLVQPRERVDLDLAGLFAGGRALKASTQWVVFAPHLGREAIVDNAELAALGEVEETRWQPWDAVAQRVDPSLLHRLLELGLLIEDGAALAPRDAAQRDQHWHPLAAVAHQFSRWSGAGVDEDVLQTRHRGMTDLVREHGSPPPHLHARVPAHQRLALSAPAPSPLDDLLRARVTCRNFDAGAALSASALGAMLARACGCHAQTEVIPGQWIVKKSHPSGGGLHPLEAYLLVRRVEGTAPGLYHYHAGDHALEPLQALSDDAAAQHAASFVAGQYFFADAPVLLALVPRFARTFWKYRAHAKAYRVIVLETGHVAQNLYLAATELGLGAFITAAINEVEIEQAFGLDHLQESPLAVCGFGARAAQKTMVEFDPLGSVWPAEQSS
jgi:putative peptide maturation dehydrogenase